MLEIVKKLKTEKYKPRYYVVAEGDQNSVNKLTQIETDSSQYKIFIIRRSRQVHQSYMSSVGTTILSFLDCFPILIHTKPNVILTNGPGTCVPICIVAFMLKVFFYNSSCKIAFIESYCRVKSLSLSGWILLYLSDIFVVQWPSIKNISRKIQYFGRLTWFYFQYQFSNKLRSFLLVHLVNDLVVFLKSLLRMNCSHVLVQRTRTSIFSIADDTFKFQDLCLVRLHVSSRCEKRCKLPTAMWTIERLRVRILMTGKLNTRLKCFVAEWTAVGFLSSVCRQVMIVDRLTLESLIAGFECADKWSLVTVNWSLMKCETVGDTKRFATELQWNCEMKLNTC